MKISEKEVGDYLREAYSRFGSHVNTQRAVAQLADGCKPVTRRVIYATYLLGNKFTKSATIQGKTIGEFHPHGSDSVYGTITGLVRGNIFDGQGQWGEVSMSPDEPSNAAAPRYTEAKLKNSFYEMFHTLLKYVPFIDAEIDGYTLPSYLPTPIPISLITGAFGIGFGMNMNMPAFTPASLYDAYIHDDYKRLRVPFDINVDYKNSDLKQLWEEGSGNIIYQFKVKEGYSLDGVTWGTIIEGDPSVFQIPIDKELAEMIDAGKVIMRDESGPAGQRLFIARGKRISVVSDDWVFQECLARSFKSINYRINVAFGDKVGRVSIREWIRITMHNYLELFHKYIEDKVTRVEWAMKLLDNADIVMEVFQKSELSATDEEISKTTGIDLDIVKDIMKSSLSSWRRLDKTKKYSKLEEDLKYWKSVDPKKHTEQLIYNLH